MKKMKKSADWQREECTRFQRKKYKYYKLEKHLFIFLFANFSQFQIKVLKDNDFIK